jgi:hypothetical protein
VRKAKYGYQIWNVEDEILDDGEGSAGNLERFAQMVKADIERKIDADDYDDEHDIDDIEELGWTVWDLETKEYLEFKGSTLIEKGRDAS